MEYKKPKGTPEKDLKLACRKIGIANGWKPHPLNVSAGIFSTPGWPDELWTRPPNKAVWLEFKVPNGKLELSQVKKFTDFASAGMPVFVITSESDLQLFMNEDSYKKQCTTGGNWWTLARDGRIR